MCRQAVHTYSLQRRANKLENTLSKDCWLVWPHHDIFVYTCINHYVKICSSVPPINVEAETVGSTWIILSWEQVLTSTVVLNQTVIVSGRGTTHNVTVDGGQSILNITDLMSGVVYTLQVVAVAEDGQRSIPSVAIMAMTLFPCKCSIISCVYCTMIVSIYNLIAPLDGLAVYK